MIINLPGSKKAVVECFGAVQSVLKHAIELITDELAEVVQIHNVLKKEAALLKKLPSKALTESESSYENISELLDKSSSSMDEVRYFKTITK